MVNDKELLIRKDVRRWFFYTERLSTMFFFSDVFYTETSSTMTTTIDFLQENVIDEDLAIQYKVIDDALSIRKVIDNNTTVR